MTDRALVWLGSSRADLRRFPKDARRRAGLQLQWVQQGLEPGHWKSMPSVGLGVREIRITTELELVRRRLRVFQAQWSRQAR